MTEADIIAVLRAPFPPLGGTPGPQAERDVPPPGANLQLFGNLVLRVALGQIDPDAVSQETWHAVLRKLHVLLPPGQHIRFVRRLPGEFTIGYPHRALAAAALHETRQPGHGHETPSELSDPPERAEEFFLARVGYYCISSCRS